jgi:shikimate dehydrogenase
MEGALKRRHTQNSRAGEDQTTGETLEASTLPVGGRSRRIVLFGAPVAHSLSPVFQQAALDAWQPGWRYEAQEVDAVGLRAGGQAVRQGLLAGANITAPHKALAASLADVVTPTVRVVGAANTWWREGSRLHADNTDVAGVEASLGALAVPEGTGRVVVLGSGGAARAAVWALAGRVARVTVVARRPKEALAWLHPWALEPSLRAQVGALPWTEDPAHRADLAEAFADAVLVVNATSLPRSPDTVDHAAWRLLPWTALRIPWMALDLSYAHVASAFLIRARQAGAERGLDGALMLAVQGAQAFGRWTGAPAPVAVMEGALAAALGRRSLTIDPPHPLR